MQVKGLPKEELEARSDLVASLKDRIEAIPDGSTTAAKQSDGGATSASYTGIKIDSYSGISKEVYLKQVLGIYGERTEQGYEVYNKKVLSLMYLLELCQKGNLIMSIFKKPKCRTSSEESMKCEG